MSSADHKSHAIGGGARFGTSYRLGGDEFCVLAALPTGAVARLLDATTAALSEDGDGFSVSGMTSDYPYRQAMSVEEAFTELRRWAGTQFDPDVVRVFCDEVAQAEENRLVIRKVA